MQSSRTPDCGGFDRVLVPLRMLKKAEARSGGEHYSCSLANG